MVLFNKEYTYLVNIIVLLFLSIKTHIFFILAQPTSNLLAINFYYFSLKLKS